MRTKVKEEKKRKMKRMRNFSSYLPALSPPLSPSLYPSDLLGWANLGVEYERARGLAASRAFPELSAAQREDFVVSRERIERKMERG